MTEEPVTMQRKHQEFVYRIESRINHLKKEKSTRPLVKPIQGALDLMRMSHDDEQTCDLAMNMVRQLLKRNYDYRIYLKSWTPPIPDHVWDTINGITGKVGEALQPFYESGIDLSMISQTPQMLVDSLVHRVRRDLVNHFERGYWDGEAEKPQ